MLTLGSSLLHPCSECSESGTRVGAGGGWSVKDSGVFQGQTAVKGSGSQKVLGLRGV